MATQVLFAFDALDANRKAQIPTPDPDEDDIMPIEALRLDDARYEMQQERAFDQQLRDDARADFDNE